MIVTIISAFRNAVGPQIDRYFCQMEALDTLLTQRGDTLTLLLGYGDSTDGTGEALFEAAADSIGALLIHVSHGGPHFGSIEDPQRFKQLAFVGNKLLANVPSDADVVGIVESDLIWEAETMTRLIDHLAWVPAIAPMIMDGPTSFYDVYAYRMNGERFTKTPPYHWRLENFCNDLTLLDSAGSVLFMNADLARKARFTDGEAIVGLCKDIYNHGGSIWLDSQATVKHLENL